MPHSVYTSALSRLPGTPAYDDLPPHLRPFADAARAALIACAQLTNAMHTAYGGQDRAAGAILARLQDRAFRAWQYIESRGAILFAVNAPAALAAGHAAEIAARPPVPASPALDTPAERLAVYLPPVMDAAGAARGACEALRGAIPAARAAGNGITSGLLAQLHDTICALADAIEGDAGARSAEIAAGPTGQ